MNCTITINYKLNASGVKQLAHLLHEQSTNYVHYIVCSMNMNIQRSVQMFVKTWIIAK